MRLLLLMQSAGSGETTMKQRCGRPRRPSMSRGATYTENMEREEGRKSTIRVIERSRVEMGIEEGGGGPRGW